MNMKKQYTKPSLKVYELNNKHQLLAGSNPPDWNGPVGYTPSIAEEKHYLA